MAKKSTAAEREIHVNKVYLVLRQLEAGSIKRLLKFLQSPYFNQSKTLLQLFELLLEQLELQREGFDREYIWSRMYGEQPYDDVNFRKACSDLLRQIEVFMAVELNRQDSARQAIDTLSFVVRHKIDSLYASSLREARAQVERRPHRSAEYFHKHYEIERLYHTMQDFDVRINDRSNIEAISHHLDVFYWLEKLRLYGTSISQRKTSNHVYRIDMSEEIVAYLGQFPVDESPVLALFYYAFLTIAEEDKVEYYQRFRALLDEAGSILPQKEALEFYDLALNYCTGKVNKGNRAFLQEYFDLFELGVNKGLFLVRGEMASWRLNNIIAAALQLGKLDWAEAFIESVRPLLPAESQENTYTFNLARVYRYQRKFDRVLKLLQNVEYEDPGFNRISKTMLALTYYELEEYEALDSFIESFRAYLIRNKAIPQQTRQSYLNLLKFVRRLMRVPAGDRAAVAKLRAEIEAKKSTTVNYDWLLEKLNELR
jgi:hypothetical protein